MLAWVRGFGLVMALIALSVCHGQPVSTGSIWNPTRPIRLIGLRHTRRLGTLAPAMREIDQETRR